MVKFERNWNVFGINEPLLFPIERAGQPEIHLARLLKDFFEFDRGTCIFYEFNREIVMKWDTNGISEKWTISDNRGCSTPNAARNMSPSFPDLYLTIKDAELVQSLKILLANYPKCKIELAKIIGIGGEGTVLEDLKERLSLIFRRFEDTHKFKKWVRNNKLSF